MKSTKKAFTLVELVVVVTILAILSTIWFVSYISTLSDSRNATRIWDMSNLKVSLSSHKLKNWTYPKPWNAFNINNWWTWSIIKQWYLNENVFSTELINKPQDPLVKNKYYTYSSTSNWLFYQIAMSLEKDDILVAFVDWDYQTVSYTSLPSIVFATTSSWDISTLPFIVDKWTKNLPYDENWNVVSSSTDIAIITQETWVNIPKFFWFYSCQEIYETWRNFWDWDYQIQDINWNIICAKCPSNWWVYTSTWSFNWTSCTF